MKYFNVQEFVGRRCYEKFGDNSIRFIDKNLIDFIQIVRACLGKRVFINNWHLGGKFDERGLRDTTSEIVTDKVRHNKLYLSSHVFGKAFDFDVEGMTAEEVRQWIVDNKMLFGYKIRLEKDVNWVHADVIQDATKPKIYLFKG